MDIEVKNIPVKKTARYFLLGKPGRHIRQVWFVCHGYGHLAGDFLKNFNALNDGYHLVVAPEGLHRFYLYGASGRVGASWMTKEDRLNDINDYIDYLDNLYAEILKQLDAQAVKINALGFSQGTATVCRWVLQGRSRVHRLILWGGEFPPDTDWNIHGQRLEQLDIRLVCGQADPIVKMGLLQQQMELLKKNRVDFQLQTFNGHHEIDEATLISVAK